MDTSELQSKELGNGYRSFIGLACGVKTGPAFENYKKLLNYIYDMQIPKLADYFDQQHRFNLSLYC